VAPLPVQATWLAGRSLLAHKLAKEFGWWCYYHGIKQPENLVAAETSS